MNLRSAVWLAAVAVAGCGGPEYPAPRAESAQLVVKLAATAKEGVRGPRGDSGDAYSASGRDPERARCYERVDYSEMEDIAVILRGAQLRDGGPAPRTAELTIGSDGPNHRLVLMGPAKHTQLALRNRTSGPLTLGCMGRTGDGFLANVPAGGEKVVTLSDPGTYELNCDEDECLVVTIVVAPTTWATLGASGREVFFDGLPAGELEVVVQAPRLPDVVRRITAAAGARATLDAEVSVNRMESVK